MLKWFFRSLLGSTREHQGLVDFIFLKTTKAFERGLEGLEMVAPRNGSVWALELPNMCGVRKGNMLIIGLFYRNGL